MTACTGRHSAWRPGVVLVLGFLALGPFIASSGGQAVPAVGDPQRGEPLFRRYCAVCHGAGGAGDGPNAPFLEEDQPRDLTNSRYLGRLSDEHLLRVITEGGQAIQGSRFMPSWGRTLSSTQIRDLVAYVRKLAAPGASAPAAGPSAGAILAREIGCPLCHKIGSLESTPMAPDLSAEGSRVQRAWLIAFLKAPRTIRPAGYQPLSRARMPDFRLSDEEAASLAEYLLSRRGGLATDGAGRAASANLMLQGRDLFRQYACRACHKMEGVGGRAGPDLSAVAQRLKPGWTMRFIQDPQAIDPLVPMPHLGVGEAAAQAITYFLFGGTLPQPEAPPDAEAAARGADLFRALGCARCHDRERAEVASGFAPDLSGAGDKLRPEWLAGFLRRPATIRPWLGTRMPGFRLDEAELRALVGLIGELRESNVGPLPEQRRFAGTISEANVRAGRRLASREFLSCSSCHIGEEQPEGNPDEWAPDLRGAGRRLNPDWIVRWFQDPQRLSPGTKMPNFFADERSGPEEILDGDEERQMLALRDYILSLGGAGSPEAGPPAAPAK